MNPLPTAPTQTAPVSLDRILSNAADGVFVIDRQKRYVLVNAALERLTGFTANELMTQACACNEATKCKDEYGRYLGGFLCPARSVFDGDAQQALQRMQISRRDGSTLWVETHYSPIRDHAGRIEFVLGLVRDVSDSKAHFDELKAHMSDLRRQISDQPRQSAPDLSPPSRQPASIGGNHDLNHRSQNSNVSMPLDRVIEEVERREILRALEIAGGQRTHAAKIMGISRSRLYRRLDALGIDQSNLD